MNSQTIFIKRDMLYPDIPFGVLGSAKDLREFDPLAPKQKTRITARYLRETKHIVAHNHMFWNSLLTE